MTKPKPEPKSDLEQALIASRAGGVGDPLARAQPLPPPLEALQPREAAPRAPDSRIPTESVLCAVCGETIVHIAPGGAAVLHTYERHVLRPHILAEGDLPLAWRCPHCDQPLTIGTDNTSERKDKE